MSDALPTAAEISNSRAGGTSAASRWASRAFKGRLPPRDYAYGPPAAPPHSGQLAKRTSAPVDSIVGIFAVLRSGALSCDVAVQQGKQQQHCSDSRFIKRANGGAVCMEAAVACFRVSTKQQQRSGLGIEAQRATVARFAETEGLTIIAEFVEAETGKGADALDRRPQLAAALAVARTAKCSVLVSKLDRLSRDVAFVAGLMAQACRSASPSWAAMPTRSCSTSTRHWPRRNGG
jgi:hypothetical protein